MTGRITLQWTAETTQKTLLVRLSVVSLDSISKSNVKQNR